MCIASEVYNSKALFVPHDRQYLHPLQEAVEALRAPLAVTVIATEQLLHPHSNTVTQIQMYNLKLMGGFVCCCFFLFSKISSEKQIWACMTLFVPVQP